MINEIQSSLRSIGVVGKSVRDLWRSQRIEKKEPRKVTRNLYKLPNELEIISRAMFGFEKGDMVRVRSFGHGGLTFDYVVMEHNSDGLSIHSPSWDVLSNDWLEVKTIKLSDVLLFVGHSFDEERAKINSYKD